MTRTRTTERRATPDAGVTVGQASFDRLPVWLELAVFCQFTGLPREYVLSERKEGRLRVLPCGSTGRRCRYWKGDVARLTGLKW